MSLSFGILGCGPSGLMAAHAVRQAGFDPIIFSIKRKSRQYGAQWLHEAIPDITSETPEGTVHYILRGEEEGYAEKVYGRWDAVNSFGKFDQDQPAWNLRAAYDNLWSTYEDLIVNAYVDTEWFSEMYESGVCDHWINSMPMESLCLGLGHHRFVSQPVWAGVARDRREDPEHENWVIYSGEHEINWYRKSNVFGHVTIEYPFEEGEEPPNRAWFIRKPLWTNCDCWPDVLRVGRYGEWRKGILTHDAYHAAKDFAETQKADINEVF